MVYNNNEGGEYGKYFVQTSPGPAMDADFKTIYDKFANPFVCLFGVCD